MNFIARKFGRLLYIQRNCQILELSSHEAENILFIALKIIKNNFKNILITQALEECNESDGITIVNRMDGLLKEQEVKFKTKKQSKV